MRRTNSKSPLKFIILGFAVTALSIGGYFGYKNYQNRQADKIYSVDETVSFSDFKIEVTQAEFKPIDLPTEDSAIQKYGALDEQENCDESSKEATWIAVAGDYYEDGPSDFNICIRRNNSRNEILKYSSENQQLSLDFKISALSNVDTSKLSIDLVSESGRELGSQVNEFNANQFFPNGAQEKFQFLAPGLTYTDEWPQEYKPYNKSDIGNNINKGLERTGYIYTDVRNSENSIDLQATYEKDGQEQTRIIRITR